jgi:hypothetical protein
LHFTAIEVGMKKPEAIIVVSRTTEAKTSLRDEPAARSDHHDRRWLVWVLFWELELAMVGSTVVRRSFRAFDD